MSVNSNHREEPRWVKLVAGGLSGMSVDFVLFPLDTIKTRLQARASIKSVALQGSFYRGAASAMMASFPTAALFWTAYEGMKNTLAPLVEEDEPGKDTAEWRRGAVHVTSAALADVVVCVLRNPFEVVKQQMQVGLHRSVVGAVRSIVRTDGFSGLYAGYFSSVAREIPFDAFQFALYEFLKGRLEKHRERDLVLWENALLGSIAGASAAGITTPLDVAKTRLMTQTTTAQADRYTGVLDVLRSIYRTEGAAALFSGIRPRVAWIGIGGAIFIGSYEEYKRRLMAMSDA